MDTEKTRMAIMSQKEQMVELISSDNGMFKVEESLAKESELLKQAIDKCGKHRPIPVPNISGSILPKFIKYCRYHVESEPCPTTADIEQWDMRFVNYVHQMTVLQLLVTAHYLKIRSLVRLLCRTVAATLVRKTTEEMRKIFNIKNDLTVEEEAEVRRENQWAFDRVV
ncbi:unnamed protein product [Calypogeia fissa]